MQVLTASLKGRLLQGRSAGGEVWRRSATELGEVGVGVALRASWSTARLGVTLWMRCRGQGELKNTDDVEIAVAEVFTGGGPPGGNPALCGRSSGRIGLGDSPAALRSFCAIRGGQWCGGEVRTRRRGALLRRSCGEAVARVAAAGWEEEERLGSLL